MEKLTYTNAKGESITFDGAPFFLVSVGGLGDVGAEIQRQKSPYQDGSSYIDTLLSERIIPIQFLIVGDDYADVSAKRIQLSRVLNPKLGEGKLVYDNGHVVREIKASAESIPFFPDGSGNRTSEMQKGLVTLVALDPYWLSTFTTEEPMSAFVGLFEFPFDGYFEVGIQGEKRTFTIDGDADAPVKITIKGPTEKPLIKNVSSGEFIQINRALSEDDVLIIDTKDRTVEVNGESVFNWIEKDSSFWTLRLGENVIEYTAASGRDGANLTIEWNERFTAV